MRRVFLFILAGCAVPAGQRVSALLVDERLTCETDPFTRESTASLTLDQEEDLYLAEIIETATGKRFSVPAVRDGREVTLTCPRDLTEITVRRVTILASASRPVEGAEARSLP